MTPPIADPDDPGFGDQHRHVGDGGEGKPRVRVDLPVAVARALLCYTSGLLGLSLGIAAAVLFAWSIVSGALLGAAAGTAVGGAIVVIVRWRAK